MSYFLVCAIAVTAAFGWFATEAWRTLGVGFGFLLVALAYGAGFVLAGRVLSAATQPRRATVARVAVPLALLLWGSLWVGGIVVEHPHRLAGPPRVPLAEGVELECSWFPDRLEIGIPFLFEYSAERQPFRFGCRIGESGRRYPERPMRYQRIDIASAIARYEDGTTIRDNELPRSLYFKPEPGAIISADLQIRRPFATYTRFDNLAPVHRQVTVTLAGQLFQVAGDKVPFSVPMRFEASSTLRVISGLRALSESPF